RFQVAEYAIGIAGSPLCNSRTAAEIEIADDSNGIGSHQGTKTQRQYTPQEDDIHIIGRVDSCIPGVATTEITPFDACRHISRAKNVTEIVATLRTFALRSCRLDFLQEAVTGNRNKHFQAGIPPKSACEQRGGLGSILPAKNLMSERFFDFTVEND